MRDKNAPIVNLFNFGFKKYQKIFSSENVYLKPVLNGKFIIK